MKATSLLLRLPLLLGSTAALAVPPLPPRVGVVHQSVADTFPPPATTPPMTWPGLPAGLTASFGRLGLPVLAQTTANNRLFAFAGRVNLIPPFITASNDEGVFSNGPLYSMTGSSIPVPQLVFSEDSAIGANFFGNTGTQLAPGSTFSNPSVQRLQISSNGIVVCQTASRNLANTNTFKQGVAANNSLADLGVAGTTLPMSDRAAPVVDDDSQTISQREQWLGLNPQRVTRITMPGGTGVPMNPLLPSAPGFFVTSNLPTILGGMWQAGQGAVHIRHPAQEIALIVAQAALFQQKPHGT